MRKLLTAMTTLIVSVGGAAADDAWKETGVLPSAERSQSAFSEDPFRQFDFWIGEWDVNLRIRQDDLSWKDSVTARALIYPILNGKAILELWDSDPIKGYSLRYFDPETERWILWLNWPSKNRSNASSLEGAFRHGRGDFFSEYENAEGETIIERYSFNDIYPNSLRWDDLNSKDGGDSWRKNWRMEWLRTSEAPAWPIKSVNAHTYDDGARCDAPEFRAHEALVGFWRGTLQQDGASSNAEMRGHKLLDGCAVMLFVRANGKEWFFFNFYNSSANRWESQFLSDKRGDGLVQLQSDQDDFNLTSIDGKVSHQWSLGDNLSLSVRNAEGETSQFMRLSKEAE